MDTAGAYKAYRIALPDLLILRAGKSGVTGITETKETEDGTEKTSTISNTLGLKVMENAYRLFPEMGRWDEDKRKAVFEWLGVGKTISWYDSSMVSAELERIKDT